MIYNKFAAVLLIFYALRPSPTVAFEFSGEHFVKLVETDDKEHQVATITFSKLKNEITYKINWSDSTFDEHFLSMRLFKCDEGNTKYWRRVPSLMKSNEKFQQIILQTLNMIFSSSGKGLPNTASICGMGFTISLRLKAIN